MLELEDTRRQVFIPGVTERDRVPDKEGVLEKGLRRIGESILLRALLLSQKRELQYQPLPWLGDYDAKRAAGATSRLKALAKVLKTEEIKRGTALDVGSHVGFFSLSLARKGWFVYAVESNASRLFLSYLMARRLNARLNPIRLTIDRTTVDYLPCTDITLCLSIWHHWVRRYGLDDATFILATLVRKTRKLLFFDTGEKEMTAEYRLPYGAEDPAEFLLRYLNQFEGLEAVRVLGTHQAIAPEDEAGIRKEARRTLFCLTKSMTSAH
jgi:hypothetical protein